jgi:hypothetical protein
LKWRVTNQVVIEMCWTWGNGSNRWADTAFAGDGNGFKLGGDYLPGPHRISRCVSFWNRALGFDQNKNAAGLSVDHNTAWANSGRNIHLDHGPVTNGFHVVRNNLSFGGGSGDTFATGTVQFGNSWQVLSLGPALTDLLSADTALAATSRRDDGSLPETPFLRPVPTGRLVDKGTAIGAPFRGTAPDLAAFETPAW